MHNPREEHQEIYKAYLAALPSESEQFTFNGAPVGDVEELLASLPDEELYRLVPLEAAAKITGIPFDMFAVCVRDYTFPNVVHVAGDMYATSVSEIIEHAEVLRKVARRHLGDFLKTGRFPDEAAAQAYREQYGDD